MTNALKHQLVQAVDEVRQYAHQLGAIELTATMPTLNGEALIDYRPGDWLRITLRDDAGEKTFVLPPDWKMSWSE